MEYSFYDFLKLLGSLALFLYGMKIMSEGLQKFAGDRLRKILTAMTTNRVTGVLTGCFHNSAYPILFGNYRNGGEFCQCRVVNLITVYRCDYGCQYRYYRYGMDHFSIRI